MEGGDKILMAAGVTAAIVTVGAFVFWGPSGLCNFPKLTINIGNFHRIILRKYNNIHITPRLIRKKSDIYIYSCRGLAYIFPSRCQLCFWQYAQTILFSRSSRRSHNKFPIHIFIDNLVRLEFLFAETIFKLHFKSSHRLVSLASP